MTANELADSMERLIELTTVSKVRDCDFSAIATMLRQQQAEIERLTMLCDCMTTESNRKGNEIEALKKQILDWENINKPNPFIGLSENSNHKPLPPNSGLGGSALKKASEK